MTTRCLKWKMVDDKHWRGLCTNEFRAVTPSQGVQISSCSVCVTPTQEVGPCNTVCSPPLITRRKILLSLPFGLIEPVHVYPDETFNGPVGIPPGVANLRVYDKYPTAAELGSPALLEATGWSNGINTTCEWKFEKLYTRWYQRTTTVLTSSQTLNIQDLANDGPVPPSNPFTGCATSTAVQCSSSTWGHSWTLKVLDANTARLTLGRFTARHFSAKRFLTGVWDWWAALDNDPANDIINVNSGWPYPLTPSITAGFGEASNPTGFTIGIWQAMDLCASPSPWRFVKISDAANNAPIGGRTWMVPTNLPSEIMLSVKP
jgi:hypothetical protein